MTTVEAIHILELYKDWDTGQRSISLATIRQREVEDDIYDARRVLILEATKKLTSPERPSN